MKCGPWLVAVAVALMPAAAGSSVVQFAAPAGELPAGHLRDAAFDAVLPSGRLVTPFGTSVVSGIDAWGVALTPDGRYAVVSNADRRQGRIRSALDPQIFGGPSLVAIDTATMRVVDRFVFPGETYFAGVTALADPLAPGRTVVFAAGGASGTVAVVDLDAAGHFTPDLHHTLALPPVDSGVRAAPAGVAATLVAARDGRHVYVVDTAGDRVGTIDTATRSVGTTAAVGFAPFGAALAGDRLLVANEGLMHYARVPDAPLEPPFATPPADPANASSLSLVGIDSDGNLSAAATTGVPPPAALPMDVTPDGLRVVGGAHPGAVAVTPDAGYAFVAMTGVDRIASVRLGARPAVAGGTELRLFDRGPYGTQPTALALSRDGTRLYVALAGLDAVAVLDARDPLHLHRLGLIPTGWSPNALALSNDDRTLYVLNTKGFGHDAGFTGDPATGADARAIWSTLQKIDLGSVGLSSTTYTTLRNTRQTSPRPPHYPRALRNVVVIVEASKSFDAMLGDLGYGPADPRFVRFGVAVTPNLHALARRYGVAGNFFADAGSTPFGERADSVAGGDPLLPAGHDDDPEDAPRAGYLMHNLARHHVTFRDYGDWVQLTGYDGGRAADPRTDDPAFAGAADRSAPTQGLGGRYTADVPAPLLLAGRIDRNYPGWNLRIRDERRAREFIRDYGALVAAHHQPRYTQVWLPADRGVEGAGLPPPAEQVADGDRALGAIVASISRLPAWKHTAIFILPDDTRESRDHIDENRAYALVVSPFAKRRYVGMRHISTVSVLKTAEEIVGVPPLGLADLLATDMSDFFTPIADARPFAALDVADPTAAAADRNLGADAERPRLDPR